MLRDVTNGLRRLKSHPSQATKIEGRTYIAKYSLVLVRVVEPLHSGVTLVAF